MNRLKHLLQHRYYLKILAVLFLILIIIYTNLHERHSIYKEETEFIGIIVKITYKHDKTVIYLKSKEDLIINYYDILNNLSLGDTIKVNGILSKPTNNTVPNLFNYQKYLSNKNIFYLVKAQEITKIKNNTKIIYDIKNKISKRINNIKYANEYINVFLLGNKDDLSKEINESYRNNGISHLFSISGMHISLFASLILYVLKKVSYNNLYNYSIVIIFLITYAILIGFQPSLLRAIIMYLLFSINKIFNLKINKVNIMLLVLIIALIINPYFIYEISFEFSYLISFTLVLFHQKIKRIKNKLLKSLYISSICFLVSMPICIYNYFQVNIISILLNIIFIPFISAIIFPLSLICFIVPKLSYLLNILINIMESISLFIDKYHLGIINFSKPSIYIIILYYICISLFLYNKKYCFLFLLIFIHKISIYFDNSYLIEYLDVGQGDSIFIKLPNNLANILIDTGGDTTNNYEIANNKTIPYLKSISVSIIDYLIITHGDFDHMGEAINLVNNFKVEKVIFNCGLYNELEKELIKVLDKKNIKHYSCIKELNIDKNKLYFLQTKEYDNENDNSNVIYTKLDGYKFMFMGDAGVTTEKEILDKYNLPDIDVLKVGHHGSKTSSSKEFINEINPKYSIISVGKNNRYGHPNKEVLDNLKDSKIYRTDQDESIMFKIKNNKLKIKTCNP